MLPVSRMYTFTRWQSTLSYIRILLVSEFGSYEKTTLVDRLSAVADINIGYFSAVIFMGALFFLMDMSPYYQGIGYEQGETIHCQWNGQATSITRFYCMLSS